MSEKILSVTEEIEQRMGSKSNLKFRGLSSKAVSTF